MEKEQLRQRLMTLKLDLAKKKKRLQKITRAKTVKEHVKQKIEEHNSEQCNLTTPKVPSKTRVHFLSADSQEEFKNESTFLESVPSHKSHVYLTTYGTDISTKNDKLPCTEQNNSTKDNRNLVNDMNSKSSGESTLQAYSFPEKSYLGQLLTIPDSQDEFKDMSAVKESNSGQCVTESNSEDASPGCVKRKTYTKKRKLRDGQIKETVRDTTLTTHTDPSDQEYGGLIDNSAQPPINISRIKVSSGCSSLSETGDVRFSEAIQAEATNRSDVNSSEMVACCKSSMSSSSDKNGNSSEIQMEEAVKQSKVCQSLEKEHNSSHLTEKCGSQGTVDLALCDVFKLSTDLVSQTLECFVPAARDPETVDGQDDFGGAFCTVRNKEDLNESETTQFDDSEKEICLAMNKDVNPKSRSAKQKRRRKSIALLDFSFLDDEGDMYSQIKSRRGRRSRYSLPAGVGFGDGNGAQSLESSFTISTQSQSERSQPGTVANLPKLDQGLSQDVTFTETSFPPKHLTVTQDTAVRGENQGRQSMVGGGMDSIKTNQRHQNDLSDALSERSNQSLKGQDHASVMLEKDKEKVPVVSSQAKEMKLGEKTTVLGAPLNEGGVGSRLEITRPARRDIFQGEIDERETLNNVSSKHVTLSRKKTRFFPAYPHLLRKKRKMKEMCVKDVAGFFHNVVSFSLPEEDYGQLKMIKIETVAESPSVIPSNLERVQPMHTDIVNGQMKEPLSNRRKSRTLSPIAKIPATDSSQFKQRTFIDTQNTTLLENLNDATTGEETPSLCEQSLSVLNEAMIVDLSESVRVADQEGCTEFDVHRRRGRRRSKGRPQRQRKSSTSEGDSHPATCTEPSTEEIRLTEAVPVEHNLFENVRNSQCYHDQGKPEETSELEKSLTLKYNDGGDVVKECGSIQICDEEIVSIAVDCVPIPASTIMACCSSSRVYLWKQDDGAWQQLHTWLLDGLQIQKLHLVAVKTTIGVMVHANATRGAAVLILGYTRDIQWQFTLIETGDSQEAGQLHCCPLSNQAVCLMKARSDGSHLTKYTLRQDLMATDTQGQLEKVPERLGSLTPIVGQGAALLGTSEGALYIWNHDCGRILVRIAMTVPLVSCFHCVSDQGLVFVWATTRDDVSGGGGGGAGLVVANPCTAQAAFLHSFESQPHPSGNTPARWQHAVVCEEFVIGIRPGQMAVWGTYSGHLETTISCQGLVCAAVRPASTTTGTRCYLGRYGIVDIYEVTVSLRGRAHSRRSK